MRLFVGTLTSGRRAAGKRREHVAPNPGRRWLIGAVALFLALLLGWVVLALQLNVASAGPLPYSPLLISRLSADYNEAASLLLDEAVDSTSQRSNVDERTEAKSA